MSEEFIFSEISEASKTSGEEFQTKIEATTGSRAFPSETITTTSNGDGFGDRRFEIRLQNLPTRRFPSAIEEAPREDTDIVRIATVDSESTVSGVLPVEVVDGTTFLGGSELSVLDADGEVRNLQVDEKGRVITTCEHCRKLHLLADELQFKQEIFEERVREVIQKIIKNGEIEVSVRIHRFKENEASVSFNPKRDSEWERIIDQLGDVFDH